MVLRAIGGLPLEGMTEEKEIAAKALECGYLRKKDNMVEPQIIVLDRQHVEELAKLQEEFVDEMTDVIKECIKEGLLLVPENRLGAEGVLMIVEK